jgi:hypothetical protein
MMATAAAVAGCDSGKVAFAIDDLDLTGYNPSMLRLIQNNRLLLRTRFPKVIVVLLGKPELKRWYGSHCPNGRVERLVDILVDVVDAYTINYQGNVARRTIDLNDHGFWKLLVSRVIGPKEATKSRGCEGEGGDGADEGEGEGEGGEEGEGSPLETKDVAAADERNDRRYGDHRGGDHRGGDHRGGEVEEDARRRIHLVEEDDGSSGTRRRRRRKSSARGGSSARHFATRKADPPCYERPPPPLSGLSGAAEPNPSRFSTTSVHL